MIVRDFGPLAQLPPPVYPAFSALHQAPSVPFNFRARTSCASSAVLCR